MTDDPTQDATAELEHIAHLFAHWRHTRTHRFAPIPPPLWAQAVAWATRWPLLQVAKRLGLKSTTLKHRCGVSAAVLCPEAAALPMRFVELTPAAPWTVATQATAVELQRPDGTRLRMTCRAPQFPLAALLQPFLETH